MANCPHCRTETTHADQASCNFCGRILTAATTAAPTAAERRKAEKAAKRAAEQAAAEAERATFDG